MYIIFFMSVAVFVNEEGVKFGTAIVVQALDKQRITFVAHDLVEQREEPSDLLSLFVYVGDVALAQFVGVLRDDHAFSLEHTMERPRPGCEWVGYMLAYLFHAMVQSTVEGSYSVSVVVGGVGIGVRDITVECSLVVYDGPAVYLRGQAQVFVFLQIFDSLPLDDTILHFLVVVTGKMEKYQGIFPVRVVVGTVSHHDAAALFDEQLALEKVPWRHVHAKVVEHIEVLVAEESRHPVHPFLVGEVAHAPVHKGIVQESPPPPVEHGGGNFGVSHAAESEVEDAVYVHGPLGMLALIVYVYAGNLRGEHHVEVFELVPYGSHGGEHVDVGVEIYSLVILPGKQVLETGRLDGRTKLREVVFESHVHPFLLAVFQSVFGHNDVLAKVFGVCVELVGHEDEEVYFFVVMVYRLSQNLG